MLTCPICGNLLILDPATLTCVGCGRLATVLDATDDQQYLQRHLDWIRRPRSIECLPAYQDLLARPGYHARLPGTPSTKKRKR
jgi:hypothetical protein